MYKFVRKHLEAAGFDVYHIGQHKGKCDAPYVVVREGSRANFLTSVSFDVVEIMVYYPLNKYSGTRPFMMDVINAMKPLGFLKHTGEITSIVIDDSVSACTCSTRYQNFKRRET